VITEARTAACGGAAYEMAAEQVAEAVLAAARLGGVARLFPEGYAAQTGDFTGGFFDPPPNYSGEAAASGCYGEKVTDPNEVGPAIRRALDAMDRQGVPAVLDMWLPKLVTGEL
jgi:hypothetical protein